MQIIDFHSHFLPGIDDGSRNMETTMQILEICGVHGVDTMIATPHFYAQDCKVDEFLQKRQTAYEQLMDEKHKLPANCPSIKLGAEVAYFEGIGRAERISELAVEGTSLLLLEMPFTTWSDSVLDDVEMLINKHHLHLIIAHLERFMKIPGNKPYIQELLEMPVTVQINAEALTEGFKSRDLVKMFKKNQAHILGSDCHGMHRRPPNLWHGREVITKKLGAEKLEEIDRCGQELFEKYKR
ncbi:MAG: CpsB/CapC family capsule biosynthesis tyrosine phosphatase [Agathobacter sp.]|nr:CpsB/CapC family capsule biosynthesis tyrosine phosphatase [Agathobacter sp.]